MKIVVGVSTYGHIPRVEGFINSFWSNFEESAHEVIPFCVDDGTPNQQMVKDRREFCKRRKFDFMAHESNRGIPAAWNTIVNYANSVDAEVVFVFNDDIRFVQPGWISRMAWFFEKNENLGTVGYPLINESGFHEQDSRWLVPPGLVGAAVGCSFAGRTKDLLSITNPDNINGYWEDLISFHEEIHMGFRLAQEKKYSLMLPWPPVWHMGGQTFRANPELTWRRPSAYLPMEQFLDYARSSPFYIQDCEQQYSIGFADRMMYSRAMFCKYWGILDLPRRMEIKGEDVDIWNEPQKYVHNLVVPATMEQEVRWINKAGAEESAMI